MSEAIVVTNVTESPIDTAGLSAWRPDKEQSPRNLDNMKLFMNTVLIMIVIYAPISIIRVSKMLRNL